jgi:hypothetical protein
MMFISTVGEKDTTQKKKLKSSVISKLLEPSFVMFESKEAPYSVDDFGISNDDLQFRDIQSMESRW